MNKIIRKSTEFPHKKKRRRSSNEVGTESKGCRLQGCVDKVGIGLI